MACLQAEAVSCGNLIIAIATASAVLGFVTFPDIPQGLDVKTETAFLKILTHRKIVFWPQS